MLQPLAFLNYISLKSIEMPSTLKMIGVHKFCDCMHLVAIELNEGMLHISHL